LALELAAARVRAMSPQQISDGLFDRYGLLTRGRRGAPRRQQSLSWCVGWSFELCTKSEQDLWERLSVFVGSFDPQAAHYVCAENVTAREFLDLLSALVEKSILIRTEIGDGVRFRFLETLRDYGKMRLAGSEGYQDLRRRHAAWYRQLLTDGGAQWFSPRQVPWIQRLTREMPNLRAALDFALGDSPAMALQMSGDLRRIWVFHGMLGEARRWLDLALVANPPQPTPQRIQALMAQAMIAAQLGDVAAGDGWVTDARGLLAGMDDPVGLGLIEFIDGFLCLLRGDVACGVERCHRALATTDDFEVQGHALMTMGWLAAISGAGNDASGWFEQAFALAEPHGDAIMLSQTIATVGFASWLGGDFERAERLLRQGLQLIASVEDLWSGAQCLELLAWVAVSRDQPRRAALLMAAAGSVNRSAGATELTFASVGGFHRDCQNHVRDQLDPADYEAARCEGDALSFGEAVAVAVAAP
jgi:hypothetical protein